MPLLDWELVDGNNNKQKKTQLQNQMIPKCTKDNNNKKWRRKSFAVIREICLSIIKFVDPTKNPTKYIRTYFSQWRAISNFYAMINFHFHIINNPISACVVCVFLNTHIVDDAMANTHNEGREEKIAIKLVRSFFFVCATEKLAFYLWQREKSSFSYYMCSTGWLFLTPHSPAVVSTGLVSYVLSICFIIILIQLALLCAVHLPQLAHRSCVNPLPFPFAPSRPISLSLTLTQFSLLQSEVDLLLAVI